MAIGSDSETILARMLRSPADARSLAVAGGLAPAADVAALVDNSGGATADKTIAVVTAPTALTHAVGTADATVDDVGSSFNQTTLNNNFKELTTSQAADRAAIVALTDAVKELSTQLNLFRTNMRSAGQML